jgi:rRNA-processing protein FCF1
VVFSPPGVIADDVIRRLAAAEPVGRVVIVVSSDREVADAVRRSGARVAESAVLLAVVGGH